MQANNTYKNKYFSILGDSLSTLWGYSVPDYAAYYDLSNAPAADILSKADTWWGQVIEYLGAELLVNNSFGGSTVCFDPRYEIPSYGCSDERTASLGEGDKAPDVIMVMIGLNDWSRGKRLWPDGQDENDLTIFSVAYSHMLKRLKQNYPNAQIWCFTYPVSTCKRDPAFTFPFCRGGIHLEKYCEAVKACAEKHQCRLIDLYDTENLFDTVDCYHPNAGGMKTISAAIIKRLEQEETYK